MPLNPLAPAFFLHNQLPSDPPITLRRPITMNLPLAQIFCGRPSPFVPPPTLHIHIPQPIYDGTDLPFTLQKNPSIEDPECVQPLSGPSTLSIVSSPSSTMSTRDQKRIKRFQQQLKAAHLDRKTLQLLLFNFRMTSQCCVICSSILLETFPPTIILLVIQLFNQQINLTLKQKYSV